VTQIGQTVGAIGFSLLWLFFFKSKADSEMIDVRGGKIYKQDLGMNKILTYMGFTWLALYLIVLILVRRRPTGTSDYSLHNANFSDEEGPERLSDGSDSD
jgi:hypothetical protein